MSGVLEIDAGNSRVKWRVVSSDDSVVTGRGVIPWAEFGEGSLADRIEVPVQECVVSSVADAQSTEILIQEIKRAFSVSRVYQIASTREMAGVRFAYKKIQKLGVDRCLAMVAAWELVKGAVLVVDAGSAITADLVDGQGVHLGGYIFPGVQLLKGSLDKGTARVPTNAELSLSVEPGEDTELCVDHALSLMVRSTLEALCSEAMKRGIGQFVMTGGSGQALMGFIDQDFLYIEDLVLDGVSLCRGAAS